MPSLARPTRAVALPFAVFAAACLAPEDPPPPSVTSASPTSVIVLIADGAGSAHWTLGTFADENYPLKRMKTVGLVDTRGADHTVSGSAPTATAYATGERSFMGAIGVDANGQPVESVLEVAQEKGMSTGLMTTTFLADATPAAFGAHAQSRSELADISRQMGTKGITVLMGGGRYTFGSEAQADDGELMERLRSENSYVESLDELAGLDLDEVESLVGLFAEGDMGIEAERGPDALRQMTETAIHLLARDPDGFFLMVENEESDTQSHRNRDEATITAEMLDFGEAVGVALDYQASNPGTLVLVTGDHETGGISLTHDEDREVVMSYASGNHTGTLIPLFATGPGAERFGGIIRNDEVGRILKELVRGQQGAAARP